MENNEENHNEEVPQGDVLSKYRVQKMAEEFKGFLQLFKDSVTGMGTPVKSIPLKPEWKKAYDEFHAAKIAEEIATRKHNNLKDYFWGLVHKDLDDMRAMRYNAKNSEIEIFDDLENNEI